MGGIKRGVEHNERLEFLGDRVLGLLTAEALVERFPDEREGTLSIRLHGMVNKEACARVARDLGLPEVLNRASIPTRKSNPAGDTILADACEALLAAIYLDGGLQAARAAFLRAWKSELETSRPVSENAKVELQHWAMARGASLPRYEVVDRSGAAHAPTFTVEVSVDGVAPTRGSGRSRQDAEKAAARILLDREVGTPE